MTESHRCPWCLSAPDYIAYHDQVWGRPVADGQELFAKLCLDGQQAGLSWLTILRKQAGYQRVFYDFDPQRLAAFNDQDIANCLRDRGIVRNRLKVESIVRNARSYLALQEQGHDFAAWLWQFVDGKPVVNQFQSMQEIPTQNRQSEAMSRALKKAGFNFVGPTICYAFMQAVGMFNDHLLGCPVREETVRLSEAFTAQG
jgi:DNA-3-methyladenine glycosylase I